MDIDNIYDQIAEQYAKFAKIKPYNVYLERPAIRAIILQRSSFLINGAALAKSPSPCHSTGGR